jgi:hypothetical protein
MAQTMYAHVNKFKKMKDRKVKNVPVWGLVPMEGEGHKETV